MSEKHEPECWLSDKECWRDDLKGSHPLGKYKGNIFEDFIYCYECETPCTCQFIRMGLNRVSQNGASRDNATEA